MGCTRDWRIALQDIKRANFSIYLIPFGGSYLLGEKLNWLQQLEVERPRPQTKIECGVTWLWSIAWVHLVVDEWKLISGPGMCVEKLKRKSSGVNNGINGINGIKAPSKSPSPSPLSIYIPAHDRDTYAPQRIVSRAANRSDMEFRNHLSAFSNNPMGTRTKEPRASPLDCVLNLSSGASVDLYCIAFIRELTTQE